LIYPALITTLAVLLGLSGEAHGATSSRAYPEALLFSAGDPHAHLQRGLLELDFEAVKDGTRVENVEPQRFTGFPAPPNSLQTEFGFAAIALRLRMSCDLRVEENGETTNSYWIQIGHDAEGGISVHHNRLRYRGTAYDGRVHEGNITFQVKFTHGGTVAEGSVRVWGDKMENGLGEPLTNCDSEPGETSAAKGKPYKWRIVGAPY
jgi:hypothetical protein